MLRIGVDYAKKISESKINAWVGDTKIDFAAPNELSAQIANVATRYYDRSANEPALSVLEGSERISLAIHSSVNKTDLLEKMNCFRLLARSTFAMPGRMPDQMNSAIGTWFRCSSYFGERFSGNVEGLRAAMVSGDLFPTHTTSALRSTTSGNSENGLKVIRESSEGITVRGVRAMATSACISDFLLILPNRLTEVKSDDDALVFGIPTTSPNLKFFNRPVFRGLSPLIDKLEEADPLVIFDDVLIPWEHIYIYKDRDKFYNFAKATGNLEHVALQTSSRAVEKLDFILGVMKSSSDLMGSAQNEHFKMISGAALRDRDIMQSLLDRSIEKSVTNRFGLHCPDAETIDTAKIYFMESYPRIIAAFREHFGYEIFQLFPPHSSPAALTSNLSKQWGLTETDTKSRLELVAILHDLLLSSYGGRQELYEAYFSGNPKRGLIYYWNKYGENVSAFDALAPQSSNSDSHRSG